VKSAKAVLIYYLLKLPRREGMEKTLWRPWRGCPWYWEKHCSCRFSL
jgi:hypothetical protein